MRTSQGPCESWTGLVTAAWSPGHVPSPSAQTSLGSGPGPAQGSLSALTDSQNPDTRTPAAGGAPRSAPPQPTPLPSSVESGVISTAPQARPSLPRRPGRPFKLPSQGRPTLRVSGPHRRKRGLGPHVKYINANKNKKAQRSR